MELQLKQTSLNAYEAAGEITLTLEETAETIVPDYCPDIARIMESKGSVFLHSRELRDGKAEAAGTVRVCVLYVPDGESGIRALELAVPFTVVSDNRIFSDCRYLHAVVEIGELESRMLNPRKIFTNCTLTVTLRCYKNLTLQLCEDVSCEPEWCLERRQEQQTAIVLTHIAEKDFTFSEELSLTAGRAGAAEILYSRAVPSISETKIVGNKLILKGTFLLKLLYRTAQGTYCSTAAELPFSQVMEAEGTEENAAADIVLQLTGSDIRIDGEDPEGRQIDVTLYFHAAAFVRSERHFTLLSDLYSTGYEVTYEAAPMELTAYHQTFNRRQTVREVLETGAAAESVLSAEAFCGAVQVSQDGTLSTLRVPVSVRVLYLDEGGVPLLAQRRLDVSCQMELPENARVSGRAICTEELQTSLGDRGVEVRFPVDFLLEAVGKTKKVCISGAKLKEDAPKSTVGTPSLVLRCLGRQESVWDLAKACNSTIGEILAANHLEDETAIPVDKLLLIPRKRT